MITTYVKVTAAGGDLLEKETFRVMFAGGRGGGCCGTMEDSWPDAPPIKRGTYFGGK